MAVTDIQPTVQGRVARPRIATKTVEHRTVTLQIRHLMWAAVILWLSGFVLSEWSNEMAYEKAQPVVQTQPASAEGKAPAPK
jgi:hypothetical protein